MFSLPDLLRQRGEGTIALPLRELKARYLTGDSVEKRLVDRRLGGAARLSWGELPGEFLAGALLVWLMGKEQHCVLPESVLAAGSERGDLLGNPPCRVGTRGRGCLKRAVDDSKLSGPDIPVNQFYKDTTQHEVSAGRALKISVQRGRDRRCPTTKACTRLR